MDGEYQSYKVQINAVIWEASWGYSGPQAQLIQDLFTN